MARPPTVPPELIREVLTAGPKGRRPTSSQAAQILAERLDMPVSSDLIRLALARHGWDDVPAGQDGRPQAMDYRIDRDLGPIQRQHRRSHHYLKMTAYERANGVYTKSFAQQAETYVKTRVQEATVADYDSTTGWWVRPAWPWEVNCYYRQPVPANARNLVTTVLALADDPTEDLGRWVTDEHRKYWKAHLGELP